MARPTESVALARRWAPYVAALASGTAALVYELLWIRRLGDVLGSTATAVQLVLAIFFGGLGLGAWIGGRLADRWRGPLALYVGLELWVALWGLLFWPSVELAESLGASRAPEEWASGRSLFFKACAAALVLAPATLAMGASLPALLRHVVLAREDLSPRLAGLYGWNTVGAALGVALTIFWWIPSFGLRASALGAALLNVVACLAACAGRRPSGEPVRSEAEPQDDRAGAGTGEARRSFARLFLAAFLAGFVSVGMEVLWTRALAARFLSTVYSFATILFVFLFCLGTGALFLRWLERRRPLTEALAAGVMTAAGVGCLASVAVLAHLPAYDLDASAQRGWSALLRRELWQTLVVVALPVWLFGLLFPLLARLLHRDLRTVGDDLGRLTLANTVGAVLAPLLIAFVVLPWLGLKWTLFACGALAVGFGLFLWAPWSGFARASLQRLRVAALWVSALAWLAAGGEVRLWREAAGDRLLFYEDGPAASVAVVERADGNRVLKVDNHYALGATRNRFAQERQGLLPVLLAGDPRRALVLGMATGSSAGAAAAWGGLEVDVLEILPGLGRLLPFFADANLDLAARLRGDSDVRLLEVDGRHFIRSTARTYDVVIGDLFVPWRAGEGAMYTLEHFRAIEALLEPGGLFCQWLPLYQLRPRDLAILVRTFVEVFPRVDAYWLYWNAEQPAIGLVGRRADGGTPRAAAAPDDRRSALLERTGLADPAELHGSWIAGEDWLRAWSADAPLETQDRPRIEFEAPARRFARARTPAAENLEVLLAWSQETASEVVPRLQAAGLGREDVERSAGRRAATSLFFRAEWRRRYQRDPEGALDALEEAWSAAPDWGWIAFHLEETVRAHADGPRRELAQRAALALGRSPRFAAQGTYLRANLEARAGALDAARELLERALALDPEHAPSRALQEELGRPR